MEKLRFAFMVRESADEKTNIINWTSTDPEEGQIFSLPTEIHEEQVATCVSVSVKYSSVSPFSIDCKWSFNRNASKANR